MVARGGLTVVSKIFNAVHRYLQYEHYLYCVPSNVSSGLANLPLDNVWFNGTENSSWPTDKTLALAPGKTLNGKQTYSWILPYFTTNEMTPDDVYKLGYEQLNKLYPLVSK